MPSFSNTMNFDDLKRGWDAVTIEPRSLEDLLKMTHSSRLPRLQKLRMRLVIELCISAVVVPAVIFVTNLMNVPPWLTTAFILCNAFFLFNNAIGSMYLHILPQEETLRETIIRFHHLMNRMVLLSNCAGISFGVLFVIIHFTGLDGIQDMALWMFLVPLTIVAWLTAKNWSTRAKEVKAMLKEFEEKDPAGG